MKNQIPVDVLRSRLDYSDGVLIWRKLPETDKYSKTFNTKYAGKLVSKQVDRLGYLRFQLEGVVLKYHRAVFAHQHGYYPETVDHINRVRSDNRIENLRDATRTLQQFNKNHTRVSSSGVVGVHRKNDKWVAVISKKGVKKQLGSFEKLADAIVCRKAGEEIYLQL